MTEALLTEFRCLRCGRCCQWEGPVRVTQEEISSIAGFLHIPLEEFLRDHTVLAPDRKSLSLKETEEGACVYYDEKERSCLLQNVKPAQCRNFPLRWNFPGWEEECEGGKALKKALFSRGKTLPNPPQNPP
ncbi:MAG: YkgJ family cysteine cluster protein, partial [Lentisphaeria bacterium]|nr:YkgJ family cysteine cluster protein [Lentisphaeria bacterium]